MGGSNGRGGNGAGWKVAAFIRQLQQIREGRLVRRIPRDATRKGILKQKKTRFFVKPHVDFSLNL